MCGIVGNWGIRQPLVKAFDQGAPLQYRGEQSAGIFAVKDNGEFIYERELGLITELFKKINPLTLSQDDFTSVILHLRYGTAGGRKSPHNAQPLFARTGWGWLAIAHNGDTPKQKELEQDLFDKGVVFSTDSDTECILKYVGLSRERNAVDAVIKGLESYHGTYALVMLAKDQSGVKLIAARDPSGNRPLALGKLDDGYVVASENITFQAVRAKFLGEIRPGELLVISREGLKHYELRSNLISGLHQCVFEGFYFGHPGSKIFGLPLYKFRERLGAKLAWKYGHLVGAKDIVTNPPDSSNFHTDGFCKAIGHPLERIFVRTHFRLAGVPSVIRSFTEYSEEAREEALRRKFALIPMKIFDENPEEIIRKLIMIKGFVIWIWFIDDTIVRGATSRKLVRGLRQSIEEYLENLIGDPEIAAIILDKIKIGLLIPSPPIIGDCGKGIDLKSHLIAQQYMAGYDPDEDGNLDSDHRDDIRLIRDYIGADYLAYLSIKDVREVMSEMGVNPDDFCFGCFEGREPIWNIW